MTNGTPILTSDQLKLSSAQVYADQPLMFDDSRQNSLHADPEIAIHTIKNGSAHGLPIACLELRCKDDHGNAFRATWVGTVRMLKQVVATLPDS